MSGYFVLCAGCDFTRDLCVHFMRRKGSVVMTIKHFTRHDIDSASGLMEANFVLINACIRLILGYMFGRCRNEHVGKKGYQLG